MEVSGLGFPYWIAVRRRFAPHDPFFVAGNIERELLGKQVALDLTEDERCQIHNTEDAGLSVYCPIVSCGTRLNCLEDFEDHYHARHMSACAICSRVYPTSRLLSIHVSEAHDSFFAAKVARGFPMYECLVEGCGAKLKSHKARKQHLIDKHKFPSSFEFKKAKPSKHQRQINQHKHRQHSQMEEDEQKLSSFTLQQKKSPKNEDEAHGTFMEVEELDELVSSVSRLSTSDSAPSSVSFGRRHAQAFAFLPRSLRRDATHHRSDAMD